MRAPRRSSSALVATVEPCATLATVPAASWATSSSARTTPSAWLLGVEGTLAVTSLPSTSATRSVNVPPTSTPSLAPTIAILLAYGRIQVGRLRPSGNQAGKVLICSFTRYEHSPLPTQPAPGTGLVPAA